MLFLRRKKNRMTQKSYNIQALRGHEYSDQEFQADMAEADVIIPDEVLYTPKINEYVAQAMYEQNVVNLQSATNPSTGKEYTEAEAIAESRALRNQAMKHVDALMKMK
jgi:hypothetical protein